MSWTQLGDHLVSAGAIVLDGERFADFVSVRLVIVRS